MAAQLRQSLRQPVPDGQQKADVVKGVAKLGARQRPRRPFGQRFTFRQVDSQDFLDQWPVAQRVVEPDQAGRQLKIDKVGRRAAANSKTNADVLAARVQDHFLVRRNDCGPERVERANGERVYQIKRLIRGNLNEAKLRLIALFAHEFGVQADSLAPIQVFDAGGKLGRLFDDAFEQSGVGCAFEVHV
jgi:hypothetical protein